MGTSADPGPQPDWHLFPFLQSCLHTSISLSREYRLLDTHSRRRVSGCREQQWQIFCKMNLYLVNCVTIAQYSNPYQFLSPLSLRVMDEQCSELWSRTIGTLQSSEAGLPSRTGTCSALAISKHVDLNISIGRAHIFKHRVKRKLKYLTGFWRLVSCN